MVAIAVGMGATLFMDLWALLLNRLIGTVAPNYCLVGRWFCHMRRGVFAHEDIATAPKRRFECAAGWIAHYAIGALYGIMLVAVVSGSWLLRPTLLPALLFGITTVVVPFLVMHPAFGLGMAASKAPSPARARLKTVSAHAIFGFGLYVCAVGLRQMHLLDA